MDHSEQHAPSVGAASAAAGSAAPRWRVGSLSKAKIAGVPLSAVGLITGVAAGAVAIGVALGGFGSAMSHANTNFSDIHALSQNLSAVGEAIRAPWLDTERAQATIAMERRIADRFYHGPSAVVPEDMVPDTNFNYQYAGAGHLNAYAAKAPEWPWKIKPSAQTPSHPKDHKGAAAVAAPVFSTPGRPVFNVVAITRGDGEWPWERDYRAAGFGDKSREAVATHVLSHELGHTVYAEAMKRHGDSSVARLLAKQGVDPTADSVAGVKALMHGADGNSWQDAALNESFADAMSLISLAKTGPKSQFDAALAVAEHERQPVTQDVMAKLAVRAALAHLTPSQSGPLDSTKMDPHTTYDAVLAIKDLGYDKLRALSREEAPKVALDCAHAGFLSMVAHQALAFEFLGAPSQQRHMATLLAAAAPMAPHGYAMKSRADTAPSWQKTSTAPEAAGAPMVAPIKSLSQWRGARSAPSHEPERSGPGLKM